MTKRERILQAIIAALETTGRKVIRNAELPTTVPVEGLVIVRDGDTGEPDVTLSPLTFAFHHVVEIEAFAQTQAKTARVAALDDLIADIGIALAGDRTFGGLAEFSTPRGVTVTDQGQTGAASIAAAMIPLTVSYSTSDPLS